LAAGALLAALALLPASRAAAHAVRAGMTTEKLVLRLGHANVRQTKLVFVGVAPALRPTLEESPAAIGAAVMLYGRGAGAGRSPLVVLDEGRWRAKSARGGLRWVYRDKQGRRGGIRKAVASAGRLTIKGGGPRFTWVGEAATEGVGLLFRLGEEWYCAEVAGTMAGRRGLSTRPSDGEAACPVAVCGDGIHEIGEECDDGNFDDHDGCSRGCARAGCDAQIFDGTWAAIQTIFQRHGCAQAVCHGGPPAAGELDLRPAVAFRNLFQVPATGSGFARIVPGAPRRSAFYLKLAKGLDPDGVDIPGAAMPSGLPPLDADSLEAIRLWIYAGAPETGTVEGTEGLLDVCLPDPVPIAIEPLPPPPPGQGVQFAMPPFRLEASAETEVCFAQYYDFTDVVPERFKDPTGRFFYINGDELRQDPQSHHLQLIHSGVPESRVHDPSFGAWTCKGGARDGESCEPLDPASCGADGLCGSEPQPSIACIGYGPPDYAVGILSGLIGGAQTSQAYNPGRPGFFAQIPLKGLLYWNSHAFNLTATAHLMHAWLNKTFTDDLRYQQYGLGDLSTIYRAAGTPPFTERQVCAQTVMPVGSRLLWLTSHTHKRGRHFWADAPDGTRLYETFTYDDPVVAEFDPPVRFDATGVAGRTIRYCAIFSNGVASDGSLDPETVRRRSRTPANAAPCPPLACAEGRVGASCAGVGDDRTCDSAPGAGDGWCDACSITSGVSTEDEMFLLFGGYVFGDIE
jgi:cysteine-rich repeat protein